MPPVFGGGKTAFRPKIGVEINFSCRTRIVVAELLATTSRFNRDVVGYALHVEAHALLIHDRLPSFDVFSTAETPARM